MVKFTIIIPIFNAEQFLHKCIESAINQTYHNLEIILVNDGSTDESLEICYKYESADQRITVLSKENEGAGEARNEGLRKATGDFVIFLDADDFLELNALYVFSELIQKHEDIEIIASNYIIHEKEKSYSKSFYPAEKNQPISGQEFLKYQFKHQAMKSAPGFHIIRRLLLVDHKIFFRKDIIGGEDEQWFPRVYLVAKNVITSNFSHYHQTKGHISRSNPSEATLRTQGIFDICVEMDTYIEMIEDTDLQKMYRDYLVHLYLDGFIRGKFYKSKYRHMVDKKFLDHKAIFRRTKLKMILFRIHPFLYYLMHKYYIKYSRK